MISASWQVIFKRKCHRNKGGTKKGNSFMRNRLLLLLLHTVLHRAGVCKPAPSKYPVLKTHLCDLLMQ